MEGSHLQTRNMHNRLLHEYEIDFYWVRPAEFWGIFIIVLLVFVCIIYASIPLTNTLSDSHVFIY